MKVLGSQAEIIAPVANTDWVTRDLSIFSCADLENRAQPRSDVWLEHVIRLADRVRHTKMPTFSDRAPRPRRGRAY